MPVFRFGPIRAAPGRQINLTIPRLAPAAGFPSRIQPAGTLRAGQSLRRVLPFNPAQAFHASMAAQASRVPRLANIQAALNSIKGARSRTTRR